jgi:penicillin-insensitive murein endopeptidase
MTMRRPAWRLTAALPLLLATGCIGPGLLTDGSSVSFGTTSTGALRNGTTLPLRGDGYVVPKRWRERKRNYGTDEIVELLVRAARRVSYQHRGSLLGVADLSPRGGGPTPEHRSHRSGRDADLILYYTDLDGKPVRPDEMVNFDDKGLSVQPASLPTSLPTMGTAQPTAAPSAASLPTDGPPVPTAPRKLDLDRNWALVRALVLDPKVSVQWIFLGRPIAKLLLTHARRSREPAYIIERAATVMQHAHSHMDHIHVRVFCAPSDRGLGCVDRGPSRWLKKEIKYVDIPPPSAPEIMPTSLALLSIRPLRLLGL